jgi:hypothetical protein
VKILGKTPRLAGGANTKLLFGEPGAVERVIFPRERKTAPQDPEDPEGHQNFEHLFLRFSFSHRYQDHY